MFTEMNFSTRLAGKLPGISPVPSSHPLRQGVNELRFFTVSNHSRRLRSGYMHKKLSKQSNPRKLFACDACSLEAVNRIYKIKGRKLTSPLAICIGEVSDIKRVATINHLPHGLLHSLLPGPVTLVLQRGDSSNLERSLNPGIDTIGVRVPDCEFIREVSRGSGSVLALTSANLSGDRSSVCVNDFESLWQHCAYVYDSGLLPSGREGSTIVDLSKIGKYKVIRPGSAEQATLAILEKYSLEEEC